MDTLVALCSVQERHCTSAKSQHFPHEDSMGGQFVFQTQGVKVCSSRRLLGSCLKGQSHRGAFFSNSPRGSLGKGKAA